MCRRTFTDNVINLAIESCLVCDIPDILTPTKVDRMSKEQLIELAAESSEVKSLREHLANEIELLEKGLKYRPRVITVKPCVFGATRIAETDSCSDCTIGIYRGIPRLPK